MKQPYCLVKELQILAIILSYSVVFLVLDLLFRTALGQKSFLERIVIYAFTLFKISDTSFMHGYVFILSFELFSSHYLAVSQKSEVGVEVCENVNGVFIWAYLDLRYKLNLISGKLRNMNIVV